MWFGRPGSVAAFVAVLGLALTLGAAANAEPERLSILEARTLEETAKRLGTSGTPAVAPEGKLIERVDIVVLDVFDEHDPVPDVANVVHAKTRDWVIRQELLFDAGDPYSEKWADETARNLRKIRQLSLVLVVPIEGSAPDRVRVLVITRDVWSLRLNWDFAGTAGKGGPTITKLVINPSEENFLGTHTSVGALFTLDAGSYSVGASASKRRLFGTDLEVNALGGVVFGRVNNEAEGAFGLFTYGSPIRTTTDHWGWGTGIAFRDDIARRYDVDGGVERFDAEVTPEDDELPIEYTRERFVGGVEVVRSFGQHDKYDVLVRRRGGPTSLAVPASSGSRPGRRTGAHRRVAPRERHTTEPVRAAPHAPRALLPHHRSRNARAAGRLSTGSRGPVAGVSGEYRRRLDA